MTLKRGAIALALLAGPWWAGGCGLFQKKEPPPFLAPAARTDVSHFAGTPLSGPTTQPILAVAPDQALAVHVRVVAMEHGSTVGQPLAAAARLITADRLGTPMLPSGRLTRGGRLIDLKDPAAFESTVVAPTGGRSATLWQAQGAVSAGTTASFVLTDPKPIDPRIAGSSANQKVEIFIGRPEVGPANAVAKPGGDPVEIAIVVQGLAPLPSDSEDKPAEAAPSAASFIVQRELAVVDRSVGERDILAITVPFQFTAVPGQPPTSTVGLVIDLSRDKGTPAHQEALSRAVEDGRKSAAQAASQPTGLAGGRTSASGVAAAFDSLKASGPALRASLVYTAGQTDAVLTEDIALVADDATLSLLLAHIRSVVPGAASPASRPTNLDLPALGWQLDKATFDFLGQLLASGKLPSELNAALSIHTGEAGRHTNSFEEVGRFASSRKDFENRLVGENLIYLDDSSPSLRVRAYDWLKARGQAPPGFDPLGSPKDRRSALDAAANAPATVVPPASPAASSTTPATVAPGGQK